MSPLRVIPFIFKRLPGLATEDEWSVFIYPDFQLAIPRYAAKHAAKHGVWPDVCNPATNGKQVKANVMFESRAYWLGNFLSQEDASFARNLVASMPSMPAGVDIGASLRHAVSLRQHGLAESRDIGSVANIKGDPPAYRARITCRGKNKYGPSRSDFDSAYADLQPLQARWEKELIDQLTILNMEYVEQKSGKVP
jgi:hypothetical protein